MRNVGVDAQKRPVVVTGLIDDQKLKLAAA